MWNTLKDNTHNSSIAAKNPEIGFKINEKSK